MISELDELLHKGDLIINSGDWDQAEALFKFILRRCEEEGESGQLALAQRKLGYIESMRGAFSQSVSHYIGTLGMFMEQGDTYEVAETLRGLGYVHWRKGDYNMAMEYFNQALERAAEAGSDELQGKVFIEMGNTMSSQGKTKEAERLYKKAISILEGTDDFFNLDRVLGNLGDAYMEREDFETAVDIFDRCVAQCRRNKDHSNLSWALMNLAECNIKLSRLKGVQELLLEAQTVMVDVGDRIGLAALKRVRGMGAHALGNWTQAIENLESALKDYKEIGVPENEGVVLRILGTVLSEKGDTERGKELLEHALRIFEDLDSKVELVRTRKVMEGL